MRNFPRVEIDDCDAVILKFGDKQPLPPQVDGHMVEKLKAEGWSDVVIARDGKYLKVTGILNGQTGNVAVDSQTGRLKVNANDDNDDDD
ncbi:MAG: hypothetical protein WAN75_12650 [Xanthobacteraceae bacterium]